MALMPYYDNPVVVGDLHADVFRVGVASPDGLKVYAPVKTPQSSEEIFQLLYKQLISLAVENRTKFVVVDLPGPVRSEDGSIRVEGSVIGPLPNIAGMTGVFNLGQRLKEIDEEIGWLTLMALNDAQAAAYAAAEDYAQDSNRYPLAYISLGRSGIGGEVVVDYETTRINSRLLKEIGHTAFRQQDGSYVTLEKIIMDKCLPKAGFNGRDDHFDEEMVGLMLGQVLGYVVPDTGMRDLVIGGYYGSRYHEQFGPTLETELDAVMAALPPHIAERPDIHYVTPEKDETMGLRGCYLAAKRVLLRR